MISTLQTPRAADKGSFSYRKAEKDRVCCNSFLRTSREVLSDQPYESKETRNSFRHK